MEKTLAISDYIIFRIKAEGTGLLNFLKLQKLLYYTQAWFLAFNGDTLFDSDFQAWIHGPVSRVLFNAYKDEKSMYSEMELSDIKSNDYQSLSDQIKLHVDQILESYAVFTSTELEKMTHDEEPWINARKGFTPYERCENIIDNNLIRDYYAARLKK